MKKTSIILCALALFILGGCQIGKNQKPSEMNPKDLPEGRAFEDEFTRSYIQSTEEVSPGYYPFLSKNEKYIMDFPVKGKTNSSAYSSKENRETLFFTVSDNKELASAAVTLDYYSHYKAESVENNLEALRSNTGFALDFEDVSKEETTYYLAPFEEDIQDGEFSEYYGIAAYIQNEVDSGGIDVIYTIYCEEDCEQIKEEELNKAKDWIQTIHFLNDDTEEDDEE